MTTDEPMPLARVATSIIAWTSLWWVAPGIPYLLFMTMRHVPPGCRPKNTSLRRRRLALRTRCHDQTQPPPITLVKSPITMFRTADDTGTTFCRRSGRFAEKGTMYSISYAPERHSQKAGRMQIVPPRPAVSARFPSDVPLRRRAFPIAWMELAVAHGHLD